MQYVAIKQDNILWAIGYVKKSISYEQPPPLATALPLTMHKLMCALANYQGREGAWHVMMGPCLRGALIELHGGELHVGVMVHPLDHLVRAGTTKRAAGTQLPKERGCGDGARGGSWMEERGIPGAGNAYEFLTILTNKTPIKIWKNNKI